MVRSEKYVSPETLANLLADYDNTVLVLDATQTVVYVVSASDTCFGFDTADALGRSLQTLISGAPLDALQTHLAASTTTAESTVTLTADRDYQVRVIPHGDAMLVTFRPLSTLTTDPRELRVILESLPDALYLSNGNGRVHGYLMPAGKDLPIGAAELQHKSLDTILPTADADYLLDAVSLALTTAEIQELSYITYLEPSNPRRLDLRMIPLDEATLLTIVRDVSKRFGTHLQMNEIESWFQALAENIRDVIFMFMSDGGVLYMNPTARRLLGYQRGLTPQINVMDIVDPDDHAAFAEAQDCAIRGEPSADPTEIRLLSTRKTLHTVELRLAMTLMNDDKSPLLLAVGRDVGMRKQAEQTMAFANLRYSLLLNNTPEGLVVTTASGRIVEANLALCEMLGVENNDLIGRNIMDFMPSVALRWTPNHAEQAAPVVMSNSFETTIGRDGRSDIFVVVNSFFIDAGDEPFIYLIVRDVTSERLLQTWLQTAANHWQVLYEIDNAILAATSYERLVQVVIETLGRLIPCDYTTMLLFEEEQAVVQVFMQPANNDAIMSSLHLPFEDAPIFGAWRTGRLTHVKGIHTSHHRLPNVLIALLAEFGIDDYLAVPIVTDKGLMGVIGLGSVEQDTFLADHLALIRNVSSSLAVGYQQLALKDQLRQYAANLEQKVIERTQELAHLNDRLRELDQLKSIFVSDVSHELRTPVNNIEMRLHLIENDTPDQQAYHLERLKAQIQYLGQLVEDILQLSRLDLGRSAITLQPVNLDRITESVVDANLPRASLKNLRLQYQPMRDVPSVLGERNQLAQVINNLVVNAINYTPDGDVLVYLRYTDDLLGLELVVEDTGIGVPDEDKPRIFERFFRGRGVAKSNIPGTGLGLGIVQEIVLIHNGEIRVEDNQPKGARFIMWLPLLESLDPLLSSQNDSH